MNMTSLFPMRTHKGGLWERGKRTRPSEGEMSERFAESYGRKIRFWAAKRKWIVWSDDAWGWDRQNLALHLARGICKEAAEAYGDPAIDSHRSAAGVLALAKCDPRLVVKDWPLDPHLEAAIDERIADHCELDPGAWTPRKAMLETAAGSWDRFDADELSEALQRRGIVYRRKGNTHGFCGIRLREGDHHAEF